MEVEVEPPHVHQSAGHRKLDVVLPVAALFVSALSIYLAWDNSKVMQALVDQNARLVQANSIPHLSLRRTTLTRANGLGQLTLQVTNSGVGPADVRSVELFLGKQPMRDATDLINRFGIESAELSTATLTNRMIRPGETIDYFLINANSNIADPVGRMIETSNNKQLQTRICYCSVFDECWTIDGTYRRPRPAVQCAPPKVPYE